MEPTGNQSLKQFTGPVIEALMLAGLPQSVIDAATGALQPKKAEELVEIDAEPPLMTDVIHTFGAGDRKQDVQLKIIGMYEIETELPRVIEIAMAVYSTDLVAELQGVQPGVALLKLCEKVLYGPANVTKKALYELLSDIFSTPDNLVRVGFLRRLPPAQIMAGVRKLKEANEGFFLDAWEEFPTQLRQTLTLTYILILQLNSSVNQRIIQYIDLIAAPLDSNGGLSNPGTDGWAPLLANTPANPLPPSEPGN
jgi:hypothetical protein